MKEIQKVVQKFSREQESAAQAPVAAYEPVQKQKKVTPKNRGDLIISRGNREKPKRNFHVSF